MVHRMSLNVRCDKLFGHFIWDELFLNSHMGHSNVGEDMVTWVKMCRWL